MKPDFSRFFTRSVWLKTHLYIALSLGLLFSLMGLTGSLSLYHDELDELFNPELVIDAPHAEMLSPDKIIASVKAAHPDRYGVWILEMPRTSHGAMIAWYEKPRETLDEFYAPLMVAVNPYTAEVITSRFWGQTLMTWILDLHTQLRMGAVGRNAVAVLGVFLMISVVSGLCLWWPGRSRLLDAFKIRFDLGLMRFLADSHRLLGFGASVILLVLAFTGFHLAYPQFLEILTASQGMRHGGDEGPTVHSSAIPNNKPVGLAEAVLVARGLFPSSQVKRISTPWGDSGTYRINLLQRHEVNQHHPLTTVWIDRWSGQIRDVRNPAKFNSAQTFTSWMWPLHTAEVFGAGGKLLWFFAGLTPLLLYISGLVCWLGRHGIVRDRPLNTQDWKRNGKTFLAKAGRFGMRQYQRLSPYLKQAWIFLYGKARRLYNKLL